MKMAVFGGAFVLLLFVSSSLSSDGDNMNVKLDEKSGGFQIFMSGTLWFSSAGVWVHSNGKWYSSQDKSLVLAGTSSRHSTNEDWGPVQVTTFSWTSTDGFNFTTYAKIYHDHPAVVFGQKWDVGGANTASIATESLSSWPTFKPESLHSTGYMTYSGNFAAFMKFGTFDRSSSVYTDIDGGFPLTVFDDKMENTLVISPLDTFMSASLSSFTPKGNTMPVFGLGIVSEVTSVPKDYSMETIVFGGKNVTGTMGDWGRLLQKKYKRTDKYKLADQSINYLGYYTDNGGCYYYDTGTYGNYEDAILAVKKSSEDNEIPYRYLQLDSWWYYKGNAGGVKNWTASPIVFPHGIRYLSDQTSWPIVAHNRYWSNDTDYAESNGGKFHFILDDNGYALPNDTNFWKYLLSTAKNQWNLMVYEQDWLDREYQSVPELQSVLNLGEAWLNGMGAAALELGLTIQYCMPWTRHILQSLTNSAVTQIRVSDDYQPGNGQWQVGDTTILAHAVGLSSFKDTFRTMKTEANCKFMQPEPYPELETFVAALTGGPIGPSDTAESFNRSLIMSTCMGDGLLLKPTRPAMSLDATFLYRVFGRGGPDGEVTVAYTEVSGLTWYFILAANLSQPYNVMASQLPPSPSVKPASSSSFPRYIGASTRLGTFPSSTISLSRSTDIIPLSACGKDDFQYWILAPVVPGTGTALFGELDKVVSISEQRFSSITAGKGRGGGGERGGDYVLRVRGAEGERVALWTYSVSDGSSRQTSCHFESGGMKEITITDNGTIKC